MLIESKPPSDWSADLRKTMAGLLSYSGQVDVCGIMKRINAAKTLTFCTEGGSVVAMSALKVPSNQYCDRIGKLADFDLKAYRYEIGWTCVHPDVAGRHLTRLMRNETMKHADGPVFATVNLEGYRIRASLYKAGFQHVGRSYESRGSRFSVFVSTLDTISGGGSNLP